MLRRMTSLRLRRRYLLALGVTTQVIGGCASGGGQQPSAEPTTTTTTANVPPTSTAAASATATAPATATAASTSVASWEPKVPDPTVPEVRPVPGRSLPTCPNGRFCVAEANARGPNPAEAPFQACAASIPFPNRESPMDEHKEVRFDAATTKRERTQTKDACCYTWWIPCPGGRPLLVEGNARTACRTDTTAWLEPSAGHRLADLPMHVRAALAEHYAAEASYEHASIASFARVSLSLLAAGAPAELVEQTHRAALDEIAHARAMYSLASVCRGEPVGPGPLDLAGAALATSSIVEIAGEAFFEGCVGEVAAALVLHEESARAIGEFERNILTTMAGDEERHAELAWRTVAWALRHEPGIVRAMLGRARQTLLEEVEETTATAATPELAGRSLPGVTTPRERALIRSRAIVEVTLPCLAALLDGGQAVAV